MRYSSIASCSLNITTIPFSSGQQRRVDCRPQLRPQALHHDHRDSVGFQPAHSLLHQQSSCEEPWVCEENLPITMDRIVIFLLNAPTSVIPANFKSTTLIYNWWSYHTLIDRVSVRVACSAAIFVSDDVSARKRAMCFPTAGEPIYEICGWHLYLCLIANIE